jgi:Family of unknown function (DUF5990)
LKTPSKKAVNFRIVGRNLPGRRFDVSAGALVDRGPVYLGIQRDARVIDLVAGDAPEAVFNFPVDVVSGSTDGLDFRGPFVHGGRGKRFLYLSWGEIGADGSFAMFRRAKLPLSTLESGDLIRSLSSPDTPEVECDIDLTDEKGGPICGSVAAPRLDWRVLGMESRDRRAGP